MGKNKKIEVFGTLSKSETLFTISDKTIPGTLVFESFQPFPGYYNEVPNESKPVYLYIGLEKDYEVFEVSRAFQHIKKTKGWNFEAACASVKIYNKTFHTLRLRHLDSYDDIRPIQEAFAELGIKPKAITGKWKHEEGIITLKKNFCIQKVGKGIFMDCSEDYHAYILLPKYMTSEEFNEYNQQVIYNWFGSKFDSAKGAFYYKFKLREMVRIYSKKLDLNYLEDLQKLYLSKIK